MTPERIRELRNVFTQAFAFGRESEVCIEAHEGLHLLAEAEAAERMRAIAREWITDTSPLKMACGYTAIAALTPPAEAEKGDG